LHCGHRRYSGTCHREIGDCTPSREKFMEELLDCTIEPEPEIGTTMVRLQAVALPEEVAGFRELKKTRLGE